MEPAELLRKQFVAFNRRDLDGWLSVYDSDVEFLDTLSLNPETYRGHDQIAGWFRGWDKIWEEIAVTEPEVLGEVGDALVIRWNASARGHGSGVAIDQDFFGAAWFGDGVVVHFECHATESDAREAAAAR